jgi:hypothetical protein
MARPMDPSQVQTTFHGCGLTQERQSTDQCVFTYGTIALCGARFHSLRLTPDFVTAAEPGRFWYGHALPP